jgi:hypothetical protein
MDTAGNIYARNHEGGGLGVTLIIGSQNTVEFTPKAERSGGNYTGIVCVAEILEYSVRFWVANAQLDWQSPSPGSSMADITNLTIEQAETHEACHVKVYIHCAKRISEYFEQHVYELRSLPKSSKEDAISAITSMYQKFRVDCISAFREMTEKYNDMHAPFITMALRAPRRKRRT